MEIDFNKPTLERSHNITLEGGEGIQKIWRFENGFGASVVRFSIYREKKIGSYGVEDGLWELAVIRFNSEDILDFKLCYDTKITNDVIGYLKENEVVKLLEKIRGLKK